MHHPGTRSAARKHYLAVLGPIAIIYRVAVPGPALFNYRDAVPVTGRRPGTTSEELFIALPSRVKLLSRRSRSAVLAQYLAVSGPAAQRHSVSRRPATIISSRLGYTTIYYLSG